MTSDPCVCMGDDSLAADENVILEIVANDGRCLYHDMLKGAPDTLAWKSRTRFIPGHN